MRREKKKKHAKLCPCLVFSLPHWILSVDLCFYWKVSGIAHFFPCCLLYLYLKKALWHKQTLVLFILVSFSCFLSYLFVCLFLQQQKQQQLDKTRQQRTNKQWIVQENSLQFHVIWKKYNNNGSFFYFIFLKRRQKRTMAEDSFIKTRVCTVRFLSWIAMVYTDREHWQERKTREKYVLFKEDLHSSSRSLLKMFVLRLSKALVPLLCVEFLSFYSFLLLLFVFRGKWTSWSFLTWEDFLNLNRT